uniref:NADH-ubiquinone oxidoreductase chain 3 n=1 Tax=Porcellio dilatatus dilatatus TaxID=96810 RepID=A0A1P8DKH0_PORDI|nr:NADH dehydrogenase subunit 3 [Porcellio dilatatus dilatatus]
MNKYIWFRPSSLKSVKFIVLTGGVVFLICWFLLLISPFLSSKYKALSDKGSPYECGFDPKGVGHLSFSVRYFLIAIIFLIFDVEIALLLPLMIISLSGLYMIWSVTLILFLSALVLGTFYEWADGALDWKE